MMIKDIGQVLRSSNFKNILILCLIFIITAFAIGLFAFTKINNYVTELSRQDIVEEFDDLMLLYDEDGLEGIKEEIDTEEADDETFFARILQEGKSIFEFVPNDWEEFNISGISTDSQTQKYIWKDYENTEGIYEYMSFELPDGAVLQMGHSIDERLEFFAFIEKIFIIGFIIIIIITLLFGIFTAGRSIIPITKLISTTSEIISQNDFKQRVSLGGLDPLHADLLTKFNYMLERVDKLIHGMRGTLDNIAHDIRTPLTRLRLSAEYGVHYGTEVQELKEALHVCIEESDRIADFFDSFLEIAQASSGSLNLKMEEAKIKDVVDTAVDLYSHVAQEKNIILKVDVSDDIKVMLDKVKMTLVLSNIVDNAIKYSEDGSQVLIQAVRESGKIMLNVIDTGIGIDSEEIDKIWEKLYRSGNGSSVKGYGLGLSYAKAVVGAHHGDISVSSKLNSGSVFSIVLPC